MSKLFFRTAEDGARYPRMSVSSPSSLSLIPFGDRTSVYCAVSSDVEGVSGKYFMDEREGTTKPYAVDEEAAAALWNYSEELTKDF